jgi:hypothetical protein
MDDDCVAQPGWIAAGLRAIDGADLVQGSTRPEVEVGPYDRTMWVDPPTWLWESCNLFVRRDAAERVGGFDEEWNAAGRVGDQYGEDVQWGWRMIRAGAIPGVATDALVLHAVYPRGFAGYVRYRAGLRHFPHIFRSTPEARRVFYRRYFVDRRHVVLTVCVGVGILAWGAHAAGKHRLGAVGGGLAIAGYLSALRGHLMAGDLGGAWEDLRHRAPREAVEFGSALYGSLRWRRLLL